MDNVNENHFLPPLIVILGFNAIGKSRLAIKAAEKFNGEIISADSRQVYRFLDIGSAKVTPEERKIVPHHLIDVADPAEYFSLAEYQQLAHRSIQDILSRSKLPIIAGGTGLYISSIIDNLSIPPCPPNEALRDQLEQKSTTELVDMLSTLDSVSAENNNLIRNRRRLIRALECCILLQTPFSLLKQKKPSIYMPLLIGLTLPFEKLFPIIDVRVDRRFDEGMIDEVLKLKSMGLTDQRLDSLGLEYRCINQFLNGEIKTEDELRKTLKTAIHQFTRRQKTWFKKDPRIQWVEAEADFEQNVFNMIDNFLKKYPLNNKQYA